MKAIEAKALTKRYGQARSVEDLSFDVEEGEIFGYLNRNGTRMAPKFFMTPWNLFRIFTTFCICTEKTIL